MSLRTLALFCFFLSGATGLFYQVLWTRLLGSTIGNTHFSITVVVSVFMGGLAFGSFLGGRVADRSRNPLRLYGILNLVGALLCLAVPPASTLGEPLFRWVYQSYDGHPEATPLLILRIVFSALLILGPTICMGATLPALAKYLTTKMSDVGFTVGRLYSVNTFGAVFGVFLAGFWAMEHLGLWGTTTLAVVIDVIIGALVIWVSRTETQEPLPAPEESSDTATSAPAASLPGYVKLAVFAFFATGFGNMVLEIAWTKAIVQTIGNSTYAFSLIVTLFILGIGLGGGIMTLVVDRLKNLNLALGVVSSLTALCVAATVPILGRFPIWGARYFDAVEQPNYDTFLWIKIWMVAIAILPSTTLMGCVFPIVGKIRTQAIEKVGSAIGTAYFANTLGAILGTLSAGFLFIPVFGKVYFTIYLGAGISLAVGLLLILTATEVSTKRRGSLAAGLAAIVLIPHAFLLPHGVLGSTSSLWDPAILSKGAYVYYKGTYYLDRRTKEVVPVETLIEETRAGNEVLWYREGIHAPVVVVKNPTKGLAMRISGKVEASIPAEGGYNRDLPHQVMAGHLPMILHPDPKEVLTLGLGGGVTLGTLTLYPIDQVDSLEISPEVIDAARRYFDGPNRGSLGPTPLRPVRNIIGDGRNHLLYTKKNYDVITSVPSNPWIAGIGTLFTEEFFQICSQKLRPGGIICNWIHKINMRTEDIQTVFRTFVSVFGEHAQLWDLGYDCLLIGSNDPIQFDGARLAALLRNENISADLASLGIVDRPTFLKHFRWNLNSIREFCGDGVINTDATPILEFSCPRGLYGHRLRAYGGIAAVEFSTFDGSWASQLAPGELETANRLRRAFGRYQRVHLGVDRFERVLLARRNAGSDDAFGVDPISGERVPMKLSAGEQAKLQQEYLKVRTSFHELANDLRAGGDDWLEKRSMLRARSAFGGRGAENLDDLLLAHYLDMAQRTKKADERLAYVETALANFGPSAKIVPLLTRLYLDTQQVARGVEQLRKHEATGSQSPRFLNSYGVLLAASGDFGSAERAFLRGIQIATDAPVRSELQGNLGFAYSRVGNRDKALEFLEAAVATNPDNQVAAARLKSLKQ